MTYLTSYSCSQCGIKYQKDSVVTLCEKCRAPLLASYDLCAARGELDPWDFQKRPKGMWRWGELLPVIDPSNIVTLGEGDTPLLQVPRLASMLGVNHLYVKDESINPTGSFKARGLSALISKARETGINKLIIPSAGNAGGALATYAAKAQLKAAIYMPKDAPKANVTECLLSGAEVILVDGLISECARLVKERAALEGWFDASTFNEPHRVEGKKTIGYELAEAFDWDLPEVIVYPTGGGTGLIGMWKAFNELIELGWLKNHSLPRFVVVQAQGCAPIVKAFASGASTSEFWQNAQTIATGLRVPKSRADRLILRILYETGGIAIAVHDNEINNAQIQLGYIEGIFAAPEGAATLAGMWQLMDMGWVQPTDRIILINTGSGLKYL